MKIHEHKTTQSFQFISFRPPGRGTGTRPEEAATAASYYATTNYATRCFILQSHRVQPAAQPGVQLAPSHSLKRWTTAENRQTYRTTAPPQSLPANFNTNCECQNQTHSCAFKNFETTMFWTLQDVRHVKMQNRTCRKWSCY